MNAVLVVAWLGALLGGALVAMGVLVPMMRDIDAKAATAVLQKTLASGNTARAGALCKAAPGTALDAVRAAIDAGPPGADAAFDREAKRVERGRKVRVEMAMIGFLLSLGALGQAAGQLEGQGALLVVHVVIWVGAAWVGWRRGRLARDLAKMRSELVPLVGRRAS